MSRPNRCYSCGHRLADCRCRAEAGNATPATLTPANPDAVIFDVMTTWRTRTGFQPLTASRTNPDTGQRQAWSRKACAWLSVAEYAAEWRHGFRCRAVMGDEETARALNDYEKGLGL